MMKRATYSAKKKNPKRIPEYSVERSPATISLSASTRSNGVRLISAGRGDVEDREADRLPDDRPAMESLPFDDLGEESVPVRITTPTIESVSGIS